MRGWDAVNDDRSQMAFAVANAALARDGVLSEAGLALLARYRVLCAELAAIEAAGGAPWQAMAVCRA